jgi:hypothetical protein
MNYKDILTLVLVVIGQLQKNAINPSHSSLMYLFDSCLAILNQKNPRRSHISQPFSIIINLIYNYNSGVRACVRLTRHSAAEPVCDVLRQNWTVCRWNKPFFGRTGLASPETQILRARSWARERSWCLLHRVRC